jgi:hypothetical protein
VAFFLHIPGVSSQFFRILEVPYLTFSRKFPELGVPIGINRAPKPLYKELQKQAKSTGSCRANANSTAKAVSPAERHEASSAQKVPADIDIEAAVGAAIEAAAEAPVEAAANAPVEVAVEAPVEALYCMIREFRAAVTLSAEMKGEMRPTKLLDKRI